MKKILPFLVSCLGLSLIGCETVHDSNMRREPAPTHIELYPALKKAAQIEPFHMSTEQSHHFAEWTKTYFAVGDLPRIPGLPLPTSWVESCGGGRNMQSAQ